ncbi:GH12438 [Drosophila grimshawi]|uniref:GH12438 n=1 Tax=Drosophila grimshawi TaxID=7222 RepID=B4JJ65_DROGR|nr:GH12438 [Drosophila grimshawi]
MSDDPDYLFARKLQKEIDEDVINIDSDSRHAKTNQMSVKDEDYQIAMRLQAEFDAENTSNADESSASFAEATRPSDISILMRGEPVGHDGNYLDQTQNLVHPEWELVDPTPDIFAMFVRFDEKFFNRRLSAVAVQWSKRMYSCAGICYQRGNRLGKEVIIRLSEPLLKLRPRKDLVETLLHEMIHAYCFVLNILEGNGGHGPNFKRIMGTINKVAGTNITVYHTFHDEVNAYKTHIWRCNGICQYHNPFQGWVKRTSNRAPGPSDQWWAKHHRECGGTFEKKSEPPRAAAKSSKPVAKPASKRSSTITSTSNDDIRKYFGNNRPSVNLLPQAQPHLGLPGAFPPTSYPGLSNEPFAGIQTNNAKKRGNIVGFKDLTSDGSSSDENKDKANSKVSGMQGKGYSLKTSISSQLHPPDNVNLNHMRDIWSKRFDNRNKQTEPKQEAQNKQNPSKRRRDSSETEGWEKCDEDVFIYDVKVPILTISDSEHEAEAENNVVLTKPLKSAAISSHDRTINIKREVMEEEGLYNDDDIVMIDDEYDDNVDEMTAAIELSDLSITEDLFGEDTLLQEYQLENDVVACSSGFQFNAANDITSCPICFEKMKRCEFTNHLEGCSITIKVPAPSYKGLSKLPGDSNTINKPKSSGKPKRKYSSRGCLRSAGYSESEIASLDLSTSSESDNMTPQQWRQRSLKKQTNQCPKCGQEMLGHQMEAHRMICKRKKR